jgi:4-hydroxythreonine-4-phosphate dehydrogenase
MTHPPLPVGITMGDAAGIGPEIIVQAYTRGLAAPAIVYGDAGTLQRAVQLLGARLTVQEIADASHADASAHTIQVVAGQPALPDNLPVGQINATAGQAAYRYVCAAIDDALAGRLRAIVTAPLNKASMHAAGITYPGHTEILADRTNTQNFAMMLVNPELRVLLVTIHLALMEVAAHLNQAIELKAIRLAHLACQQLGILQPRIAVAGLNPHAGENGKFGQEEIHIIAPAIATACATGINVTGPWPGDTVFMRARRGEFDIVVAQYHDQGLIPIKYLGIEQGVNITVGLPFVRTSVDHGTAFDIAWQGIADPTPLIAAFEAALAMSTA